MSKDEHRRKFDITKYFYIAVAIFALIGGSLGFYNRVIADASTREGITTHNGKPEAHYEANKGFEARLVAQALVIVKIESSVLRVENMYKSSEQETKLRQFEILELLRNQ